MRQWSPHLMQEKSLVKRLFRSWAMSQLARLEKIPSSRTVIQSYFDHPISLAYYLESENT